MRLQTQVAPEIQKRLLLSRVEAESLKERENLLYPQHGRLQSQDSGVSLRRQCWRRSMSCIA